MSKLIVGIDFGTSTTVVRACLEGTDIVYSIKHKDSNVIPTLIFKDIDGNLYYGKDAESCNENGTNGVLIQNFKMGLTLSDKEKKNKSKEYIKNYLKFIYDLFKEQYITLPVHQDIAVYISYPAKWTTEMADFMISTVKSVGFGENVYGMTEPEAASCFSLKRRLNELIAKGVINQGQKLNVMMLDLGAGTSDISIFRASINAQKDIFLEDVLSYPPITEKNSCGGREIDMMISKHVVSQLNINERVFPPSSAKQWKESYVSDCLANGGVISNLPSQVQMILSCMGKDDFDFKFSKQHFESETNSHWSNLYKIIAEAIAQYEKLHKIGATDIDLIFLTGGHSRWYCIKNLILGEGVNGCIGKDYVDQDGNSNSAVNFAKIKENQERLIIEPNPHETVALGMCLKDSSIMFNTLMNNVWVKIKIGNTPAITTRIANIGDKLPIEKDAIHKVSINTNALDKIVFDINVTLYFGPTLQSSKAITFTKKLDNDSGRWVTNIILCGLPILWGGYNTTIATPLKIAIKEDNTISINGTIKYANGENVPIKDLEPLKDSNDKIVIINQTGIR